MNPTSSTINDIIEGFEKIGSGAFMVNKNKELDEKRKEVQKSIGNHDC
jgi:hypothetical protein